MTPPEIERMNEQVISDNMAEVHQNRDLLVSINTEEEVVPDGFTRIKKTFTWLKRKNTI